MLTRALRSGVYAQRARHERHFPEPGSDLVQAEHPAPPDQEGAPRHHLQHERRPGSRLAAADGQGLRRVHLRLHQPALVRPRLPDIPEVRRAGAL